VCEFARARLLGDVGEDVLVDFDLELGGEIEESRHCYGSCVLWTVSENRPLWWAGGAYVRACSQC
jgi:hypothetical protein